MQLLPILIAIVLGVSALTFVLYPFYGRKPGSRGVAGRSQDMPLLRKEKRIVDLGSHTDTSQVLDLSEAVQAEREQAARNALQEIELDYQLGNITEADYRTLREKYVRRAVVALKSRYDREQELDEVIEAKLQEMREKRDNAK